jgi:mono/diheme cytochrome c family protein
MSARSITACLLLALAGCASPPERDPSQWPIARVEVERAIPTSDPAEATYRAHCIACHGVDGRGAGGSTGANFTAPDGPLTRPDEELLHSILDGRQGAIGVMPAHRDILGEERARAVLTYVRSHFGAGIEVRAAVDPEAGTDVDAGAPSEPDTTTAPPSTP